jgi:hypothetical protein
MILVIMLFASCGPTDLWTAAAQSANPIQLTPEQNHGLDGVYYGSLAAADFDHDGRLDLVIGGNRLGMKPDGPNSVHDIRLYRNSSSPGGNIRFTLQQVLSDTLGYRGTLVKVADFNNDDRPDIAVQFRFGDGDSGSTASFLNQGGWRFSKHLVAPGLRNAFGMEAADVDQDGRADLIFSHAGDPTRGGLWYRLNATTDRWESRQDEFTHDIAYGGTLAAGDLTGDGFPEIAVGGNSRQPFGSYDCTANLLYGQIHRNRAGRGAHGFESTAMAEVGRFGLRFAELPPEAQACPGMDNAQMLIADVDRDGTNDIVLAGSTVGFTGRPGQLGSTHYDFAVLRNVDGSGANFITWENVAPDLQGNTTNSGVGNLDFPNAAIGDLTGDGYPEIFIQGHRRDHEGSQRTEPNPFRFYIYEDRLFLSKANGTDWEEVALSIARPVAEGGQVIADFNNDGRNDLIFTGAERAFHTNGENGDDLNTQDTIVAHVFRNTGGAAPPPNRLYLPLLHQSE